MKKITTFLAIGIIFISLNVNAQAPSWAWVKSAGGSANDGGNSVSVDGSGNSYVTGSYASTTITFGSTTFTNTGGLDFYVVKYDVSGNVLWAKTATGASNDVGYKITSDASGNTYIAGSTNSASLTFGSITLTQHGYDDIFIVKYDPSGSVVWAKSAGGTANDIGESISIDAKGNSYVTGYFASSSLTFGTSTLTNSGVNNMYIVKYDPTGNVLWAKSAGGSNDDRGNSIISDAGGNTYVTGSFTSSSISFGSTVLTNTGAIDFYIVKYDPSGTVLWAQGATGVSNDVGYNVKVDAGGNAYVIGSFNSSLLKFGSTTLTLHAYDDIFIVKYDPSGNVLWAKSAGGTGNDVGEDISIDAGGNSYITGYFASTSLAFGSTILTNTGTNNIYVAKYDPSGNVLWATSIGGAADDRSNSIALDINGNAYITGYFTSATLTIGSTTLTNNGGNDMYASKLLSGTSGIDEERIQIEEMTVIPNPNNGLFDLQINNLGNARPDAQISIIDMLGREVYHSTLYIQNFMNRIDISNQSNGLYYVSIRQNDKLYRSKVVISR